MKKAVIAVAVIAGLGFGSVAAVKHFNAELYAKGEAKVMQAVNYTKAEFAKIKADAQPVIEEAKADASVVIDEAKVKADAAADVVVEKVEPIIEAAKVKVTTAKDYINSKIDEPAVEDVAPVVETPVIEQAVTMDTLIREDLATATVEADEVVTTLGTEVPAEDKDVGVVVDSVVETPVVVDVVTEPAVVEVVAEPVVEEAVVVTPIVAEEPVVEVEVTEAK